MAFPDQDHMAHISSHIAFIKTNLIQTSPAIYGILLGHVFQHITHMAMQQAMQQAQEAHQSMPEVIDPRTGAPMQMAPPLPPMPLMQKAAAGIEAQMIAQILQQLSPDAKEDPLISLQQRDLDIREQAVKLKSEEAALRIDLDERKLEQRQAEDEQKRKSLEDIQQLRANVSLARAEKAKMV